MSPILIYLILMYSLYNYPVYSTKHNIIQGEKFLCGTKDQSLANVTCKFKRVNRTTEFWSFDGFYAPQSKHNNTNNLYMNVTVYARQQNLEWRPHMIVNYIVNICQYMDGSLGNKLIDIILNDLKRSSNFMHPCPHVGHFYLRNMTLSDDNFPPIVPRAEIYVDFQYFTYIDGEIRNMQYLRPYLEVKTKGIFYFK